MRNSFRKAACTVLGLVALVLVWGDARRALSYPGALPGAKRVEIKISAVGDVMFGRYGRRHRYRPFGMNQPFARVKKLLAGRDIVICNLETPISARRYRRPYRNLSFRAPPKAARMLKDAGFTLAATANNHAWDQGDRGVRDTIDHLKRAGVAHAGTGRTLAEAFRPWVFVKQGVRVGVLSVTMLRNYPVRERVGFVAFVHYRRALKDLPGWVAKARRKLDFLVVSLHFGQEYKLGVIRRERRLMSLVHRAGADVVFGHHPHVLRPIERRKKFVVFYSLGNFLMDFRLKHTGLTGVAEVTLVKQGARRFIDKVGFVPVWRHWKGLPRPAVGRYARLVRRLLYRYTRRMGVKNKWVRRGEGVEIQM